MKTIIYYPLLSIILTSTSGVSSFGQWEKPKKIKNCPAVKARLVTMTHGTRGDISIAIAPDGKRFAVTSRPGVIPSVLNFGGESGGVPLTAATIVAAQDSAADGTFIRGNEITGRWRKLHTKSPKRKDVIRSVPTTAHVGIFDVANGKCLDRLADPDNPDYDFLLWSDDGSILLAQDKSTVLWDVSTGKIQSRIPRSGSAALSPDGKHLLMRNEHVISLYNTKDGSLSAKITGDKRMMSYQNGLAYSQDGKRFAIGYSIWNAETGKLEVKPPSHTSNTKPASWINYYTVYSPIRFSKDGKSIIGGKLYNSTDMAILNIEEGKPREIFQEKKLKGTPLDGSQLASNLGLQDNTRVIKGPMKVSNDFTLAVATPEKDKPEVQLWLYSLRTGDKLAKLTGPDTEKKNASIKCIAISADNQTVAVSRNDGATLLWDISKLTAKAPQGGTLPGK